MRHAFVRSVLGLFCVLLAGVPASPVLGQEQSARLTIVFLQLAPGGGEKVVTPEARGVLTAGELDVLSEFCAFSGVVSLAKVVEITDASLSGNDRRAVVVLSRWKPDGVDRSIALPRAPGAIYLVAIPSKEHGEELSVLPSSTGDNLEPLEESDRWMHLSIDLKDGATVRYTINRPGKADLKGTAFAWRD